MDEANWFWVQELSTIMNFINMYDESGSELPLEVFAYNIVMNESTR